MTPTYHLTPTLVVAPVAFAVSAEVAEWKIRHGEAAVVATLDIGREVLLRLGMPEDEADTVIRFATTGSL